MELASNNESFASGLPPTGGKGCSSTCAVTNAKFVQAAKRIGGKDAPVDYSFEERVFSAADTAPAKAAAKLEVVEMLRSRILSAEKPQWNMATSNWDNMQMTGKCYKRTNVNAEVRPLCGACALLSEREVLMLVVGALQGIAKCVEELPNHPDLRDAEPWNQSVELTKTLRKEHVRRRVFVFATLEAARQANSAKWKRQVGAKANYKNPEQLSRELAERIRQEKQEAAAAKAGQPTLESKHTDMSAPSPPESLVQYGDPIFTGETLDPPKRVPGTANSASSSSSMTAAVVAAATDSGASSSNGKGSDGVARVEDILNAVLPPQYVPCILILCVLGT
ncbi:hypothetical protein BBJ28_00016878 [Nothophytophthora sp. Chile5]|nr:hypothetical protein BBJ28_00016878 [Nothophytophthora sp. Chile5]